MDGRGVPLSLVVTGANVHDCKGLDAVLGAVVVKRKSPPCRRHKHLCADAGYRGAEHLRTMQRHGYIPHVVGRRKEAEAKRLNPKQKARRWVVEVCQHQRGVDVQVVVDKSQKGEKYTSATFVANAGIPIRIDSKHAIAHNKIIIVDGHTVQQGSFNYTRAAEEKNGENVLVNWNNAKLAEVYLKDWKRHWEHSDAVAARY